MSADNTSRRVRKLFALFASNWRQFFAIHLSVNVLVFVILVPAATLMLRAAISLSGDPALSDQDIFFFIMSPMGFVAFLVLASLFSIIVFLEYAALISAAWRTNLGRTVSISWVLNVLTIEAPRLFGLAMRILLRVLLIILPYALLLGLIYYLLLSSYDINYYLSVQPPEWQRAVTLSIIVVTAAALHLLHLFTSLVFSLPILLLKGVSPTRALSQSRAAARGSRAEIVGWIASWLIASLTLAAVASWLGATTWDLLIPVSVESMRNLLLIMSFLTLLGFVVSFAITFISTSMLCLLILALFESATQGEESLERSSPLGLPVSGSRQHRVFIAAFLLAGIAAAIFMSNSLLDDLLIESHTEIMAHRGASAAAPENTLAAVEAAIDAGARWVEIDVQETADGEVVVIHDRDLKKVGGVALAVATSSLHELQQVDIGSWFSPEFSDQRIPTLRQVLDLCKDRIRVNIELKYYGSQVRLEERVAEIVEAAGMADQVMLMSLDLRGIREMSRLRPDWTVGLLSSVAVGDLARMDVDFLALNARAASRHLIRRMHGHGKDVMVWTVNDAVGITAMAGRGVDYIITDEPALAVSLLEQHRQLQPSERLLIQAADFFDRPSLYREQ